MHVLANRQQSNWVREDFLFLGICAVLLIVGAGSLFSGSAYRAYQLFGDPYYFIRRHLLWIIMGTVASVFIIRTATETISRYVPWLLGLTLLLLLLTLVDGIGTTYLGARRWIEVFGVTFQPSELAKVTLIFYLSLVLSRKGKSLGDSLHALLPPLIVVALFTALVYLQNDFSTALLLVSSSLFLFFLAGIPLRYFGALGILLLPIAATLLFSHINRVQRIIAFLSPTIDPQGSGYQVLAARNALRNGGIWGAGIGNSGAKLGVLPEAHSDFIFAVVAEELGVVGTCLLLSVFVMFAVTGLRIAERLNNGFEQLLVSGLVMSIFLQSTVNIAVTVGVLPPTGIPLPFFSSGGSALLMTMIMCATVFNIASKSAKKSGGRVHA